MYKWINVKGHNQSVVALLSIFAIEQVIEYKGTDNLELDCGTVSSNS